MSRTTVVFLLVAVTAAVCQKTRDWHVGVDTVNPSGTVVHGHANVPFHSGSNGRLDGNVHGSKVFGGPYDKHHTVGGGLQYQHNSGLHGGVDVTHSRGSGNTYSATVGGSRPLGPGTLSIDGGAFRRPGSSHVGGQIGGSYKIRF